MIKTKTIMKYKLLFIFFISIIVERENQLFSQNTKLGVTSKEKNINKSNKQINKTKPTSNTNSTINRVNTQWKTNTNLGMYRGWPVNPNKVTTNKKDLKSMNDIQLNDILQQEGKSKFRKKFFWRRLKSLFRE